MKGVEPPRRRRQILSLVRLPIPPHPHFTLYIVGGGWWIRTPDIRLRRALLYPAELCTHILLWSGKRDSNSRLSPWQGDALPLNYSRIYNGGNNRTRTCDPLINSQLLYQLSHIPAYLIKLATWKGLEPSTSSVTGWHSNQLNYQAANGGTNRARTCDPLLVRQVLSQLSYSPISLIWSG